MRYDHNISGLAAQMVLA